MGFTAAKFDPSPIRPVLWEDSFLSSTTYLEFLQRTHPEIRLDLEGPLPSYVAPLNFYEPLKLGFLRRQFQYTQVVGMLALEFYRLVEKT